MKRLLLFAVITLTAALSALADIGHYRMQQGFPLTEGIPENIYFVPDEDWSEAELIIFHEQIKNSIVVWKTASGLNYSPWIEGAGPHENLVTRVDNSEGYKEFLKYVEDHPLCNVYYMIDTEYYFGRTDDDLFNGFKQFDPGKDGIPSGIFNASEWDEQSKAFQATFALTQKYTDVVAVYKYFDVMSVWYSERFFEGKKEPYDDLMEEVDPGLGWFQQMQQKYPYLRFFYFEDPDAGDTPGGEEQDELSAKKGTMPATIDGKTIDVGYVQLWDHGPRFAVQNVGATSPTDFGGYYTWGGHVSMVRGEVWSKGKDIQGTNFDTAIKLWGENWQTPTQLQMNQLIQNCDAQWVDNYQGTGVAGCIFTGRGEYADNQIFLPAAGYYGHSFNVGLRGQNKSLHYWTSTPNDWDGTGNPRQHRAYQFYYATTGTHAGEYNVAYQDPSDAGYSVRPIVRIPTKNLPVLPVDLSLSPSSGSSLVMLRSIKVNNADCSFDYSNVEFDVKNASGVVVTKVHLQEYKNDGYSFVFDNTVFEKGDYSFVIPEGTYVIEKKGKLYTNTAIDYRFTIEESNYIGTYYFPAQTGDFYNKWQTSATGNIMTASAYGANFYPQYVDIIYPDGSMDRPSNGIDDVKKTFLGFGGGWAPYNVTFKFDRYKNMGVNDEPLSGEYRVIYHTGAFDYMSELFRQTYDFLNEEYTVKFNCYPYSEQPSESLIAAYNEMNTAYKNYLEKYDLYNGNSRAVQAMHEGLKRELDLARKYSSSINYPRTGMELYEEEPVQAMTKHFTDAAKAIDDIKGGDTSYDLCVNNFFMCSEYIGDINSYTYDRLHGRELQAEYFKNNIFRNPLYISHLKEYEHQDLVCCYNLEDLKELKETYEEWYKSLKYYERHYIGNQWERNPEYEKFEGMTLCFPGNYTLKSSQQTSFEIRRASDDQAVAIARFESGAQDGVYGSFGFLKPTAPLTERGYYYIDFPDAVFTASDDVPTSEVRYSFGVTAGSEAAAYVNERFTVGNVDYRVTYCDFMNDRNTVEVVDIRAEKGDRVEIPSVVSHNGAAFTVTSLHCTNNNCYQARYICFPPTLQTFNSAFAQSGFRSDYGVTYWNHAKAADIIFTSPEPVTLTERNVSEGYYNNVMNSYFLHANYYVSKDAYEAYATSTYYSRLNNPESEFDGTLNVIDPDLMPEKAKALEESIEMFRTTLENAGILGLAEDILKEIADALSSAPKGIRAADGMQQAKAGSLSIAYIKYLMDRADELCAELSKYCFVTLDDTHRLADYVVSAAHGYGTDNNIRYVRIRGELKEEDISCMQNYFTHVESLDLSGATFGTDVYFRTAASSELKEILLPASVSMLDYYSMPWHVGNTNVYLYYNGVIEIPYDLDGNGFTYYVPDEYYEQYLQHPGWKNCRIVPMSESPDAITAPAATAASAARKVLTTKDGVIIIRGNQRFNMQGLKK